MKSRELERAKHIHACLDKVVQARLLKKYSDRLKGAPAELMENGLLQTLAFYRSKGAEYDDIASHLSGWLQVCGMVKGPELEGLAQLSAVHYRRCSEEAVAWLNWAKRLAMARVAKEDDHDSNRTT
jgi:CRISPR-associated protein Cmr5